MIAAAVAVEFPDGSVRIEPPNDGGGRRVAIAPDRLRSALAQLVQNAIEASCPGDRVIISGHRRGGQCVIDVADHGPGMDDAFIRDELFLPFRSTKSGGYGIGVFQTRELIRMAGGDLEVISEPGEGTTMRSHLAAGARTGGGGSVRCGIR